MKQQQSVKLILPKAIRDLSAVIITGVAAFAPVYIVCCHEYNIISNNTRQTLGAPSSKY